ncbi:MAG: GHKL domain-containing protein, partial [Bryobacteraceae bacterium]|nr:GHKL domain-containing protein [Bryobacteraceae bacterium]
PVAKQLIQRLADIFPVSAAVLYERRTGQYYRAGPSEFDGLDEQLRDAALQGASFSDPERKRVITAIRLGSQPIAALALQGSQMPDAVLQGMANLTAIGLERARSQDLLHQVEAARRSEELRTALIDTMAHEFKTPLTSIKAATTALLADPNQSLENRTELLTIADEEAERLKQLIDDAVEMARLDNARIKLDITVVDLLLLVEEVRRLMRTEIDDRPVSVRSDDSLPLVAVDRRLVSLAMKQLLDNALKYSPQGSPIDIHLQAGEGSVIVEITNSGNGILPSEQGRIFERFFRSPSIKLQIPGSGLGLSIARSVVQAHGGELTVRSREGSTTFRMILAAAKGDQP